MLALWIAVAVAWSSPVHAQSNIQPHILSVMVGQGQGQVCWSYQQYGTDSPVSGCTTTNATSTVFDGQMVTFTATGMNGYVFDHWVMPDMSVYTANPISLAIPVPVQGGSMNAVFVSGILAPEFPQMFLMLGAIMVLGVAVVSRSKVAK